MTLLVVTDSSRKSRTIDTSSMSLRQCSSCPLASAMPLVCSTVSRSTVGRSLGALHPIHPWRLDRLFCQGRVYSSLLARLALSEAPPHLPRPSEAEESAGIAGGTR